MDEDYDVAFLVSIIDSATIPEEYSGFFEQELPAKDGWKVGVHYRWGDFSTVEYLETPEGKMIDPWWTKGDEALHWTQEQWEEHQKKWELILQWQPPRYRSVTQSVLDCPPLDLGKAIRPLGDDDLFEEMLND